MTPRGINPRLWFIEHQLRNLKHPGLFYFGEHFDMYGRWRSAPIIFDYLDCLSRHACIIGGPGTGKTSWLKLLILQAVRIALEQKRRRKRFRNLVVIDVKGDRSLLNFVRYVMAAFTGAEFWFFSNSGFLPTRQLNLLNQPWFRRMSPYQRAELVMKTLGLAAARNPTEDFYEDQNDQLFDVLMNELPRSYLDMIPSVEEAMRIASGSRQRGASSTFRGLRRNELEHARHITAKIRSRARRPENNIHDFSPEVLNPLEIVANQIDFERLLTPSERPIVCYFYLRPQNQRKSTRYLVQEILAGFDSAASLVQDEEQKPLRGCTVILDEAARVAEDVLIEFVESSRHHGLPLIWAHQSTADFSSQAAKVLFDAAALRVWLGATHPDDQKLLQSLCGEQIEWMISQGGADNSLGVATASWSKTQQIKPRFSSTNLLSLANAEMTGVAHFNGDPPGSPTNLKGIAFPFHFEYATTKPMHEEFQQQPLRDLVAGPGMIIPNEHEHKFRPVRKTQQSKGSMDQAMFDWAEEQQ